MVVFYTKSRSYFGRLFTNLWSSFQLTTLFTQAVTFVPPVSVSSSQKTSKKKPKPFVAVSAEQTRIEFLQAELATAQTRIVQLDASVKDKDQTITILNARLKVLEEKQATTIHEKYFPPKNPFLPHTTQPSCSSQQVCCHHPPVQCYHAPHPYPQPHPSHGSSSDQNINSTLQSSILKLEEKVNSLSEDTKAMQSVLQNFIRPNESQANEAPTTDPDPVQSEVEANNDESIESMEEFIFDDENERHLNCLSLTNQY